MTNRIAAAVTAGLVLVTGLAGVALAATETVADDFSSGGYGGSTGTMAWAGNWEEVGESDGSNSGAVQVRADDKCASGGCLTIDQMLGGLDSMGAMRALDLSAATSASLTYHIDFPGGLVLDGAAVVEARAEGGGWSQLSSRNAGTSGRFTSDLPIGGIVHIRFRAVDLALSASMAFDDVEVDVVLPDPTTTTTTTSTTTTTTSSTTTEPTGNSTTSTTTPVRNPTTTTAERDRASDDRDDTTTLEPSAEDGAQSTTTTDGGSERDGDGVVPASSSTTVPGTTAPEQENTPDTGGGSGAVVTEIHPLADRVGGLEAQEDLLVIFGLAVEDIALDIVASALLGLVLAGASLKRLH